MKATAIRATKAMRVSDAATVLLGVDEVGFKRCDISIHRTSSGGLHVDIEVPVPLAGSVAGLLGVKAGRGASPASP
jgi:hypothetical protein